MDNGLNSVLSAANHKEAMMCGTPTVSCLSNHIL
jgi:hypothetical protein